MTHNSAKTFTITLPRNDNHSRNNGFLEKVKNCSSKGHKCFRRQTNENIINMNNKFFCLSMIFYLF